MNFRTGKALHFYELHLHAPNFSWILPMQFPVFHRPQETTNIFFNIVVDTVFASKGKTT